MCGIFGFVAGTKRDPDLVLDGLRYLEYRGYDSWGVAVGADGIAVSSKAVGKLAGARTNLPPSQAALGHTRWATHGGVTRANAHPHSDCRRRLALIHNGIIENHEELASRLRHHHSFLSQTDTEVMVHLLEEELEHDSDLLSALLAVFRQAQGLSAVAVLDAATGQVAAAKNGSPLVLGWGADSTYLASDPIALLEHTRRVTFLDDGQAALLSSDGIRVYDVASGRPIDPEQREVTWDTRQAGLDGHPHFMAKEIHEQPRVLREIGERKRQEVKVLADLMAQSRHTYLIGCGTAHHAAMSGRYMLAEFGGLATTTAVASEMSLITPSLSRDSLVIALSQSGETVDVLEAVRAAKHQGATVAALVNSEGSALDRMADLSILLQCGPERCVLATKSYTAKLAVLAMAAYALAGAVDEGAHAVCAAGNRVESLLDRESAQGRIAETARMIADEQHLFVLGRHRNYPLALEAALKIKEVSYMHAEGFAAGELKHGVIALITKGTPCIVLAPDEDFRSESLAAAAQVRARGALTIGISPRLESEFDQTLAICGASSAPFEIAAATQILAYELALLRGCDPDKPRNLAKSVTVK